MGTPGPSGTGRMSWLLDGGTSNRAHSSLGDYVTVPQLQTTTADVSCNLPVDRTFYEADSWIEEASMMQLQPLPAVQKRALLLSSLDDGATLKQGRSVALVGAALLVVPVILLALGYVRTDRLRGDILVGGLERKDELWCGWSAGIAPELWIPQVLGIPVQVKVLTYNLQWWALFQKFRGLQGSAGKLIAASGRPQLFDFMGFQECEDPLRVLRDAGLATEYSFMRGSSGLCVAYYASTWLLVAQGEEFVAEDTQSQYYGKRAAQWIRVRHASCGKMVFLVNHHGPLPVNTGGVCGGIATAHNLLKVISRNAQPNDAVILLGDFNADDASLTVQELGKHLFKVYTGASFGGVDHIFSNTRFSADARNLGSGGSDHDALTAIIEISAMALPPYANPGVPLITTITSSSTSSTSSSSSTTSTATTTTTITTTTSTITTSSTTSTTSQTTTTTSVSSTTSSTSTWSTTTTPMASRAIFLVSW